MNMNVAFISFKFGIFHTVVSPLEQTTVFEEHLTQKHHFLFVYFDEYECGIYSNEHIRTFGEMRKA
jgi:hypothetical protein